MGVMAWLLSRGADKQLKTYRAEVARIGELEPRYQKMTDDELRNQTTLMRERMTRGETLRDLRDEAFAACREAAVRTLGMRHFDEQLIAALTLDDNMIAEAATGSGKTLACTPAVYLNALTGDGVHVVTVNDYLAGRDADQMGKVYAALGITCDCLQGQMPPAMRKAAYKADVTYGTNSEFGFDYLRDNMATSPVARVQRGHNFAIVDEVDSILIDEARTPLIISGEGTGASETYRKFAAAMRGLRENEHFVRDEAKRTIATTDEGLCAVERSVEMDIYGDTSGALVNHLQNALKAQFLFTRDVDYLVKDGEVLIVDEFTGRVLPGRRYSEGLHQAIEAKEGVRVQSENETLATITLQNYFRLYSKLAGMTGTAMTEDAEFRATYNLPVVAIPDHKPCIRKDQDDLVFATVAEKYDAIVTEVASRHQTGQPVLVGTTSIESSERLSNLLRKRGVPHSVLNAKHHAAEAQIVAQAGRLGAVTVATNMAGRGTDIMLGGNAEMLATQMLDAYEVDEEGNHNPADIALCKERAENLVREEAPRVREAGGLLVIGSERHESRRIDNQLRGRSGRQGDPGETRFYLSLEDDLVRKFAGERAEKAKLALQADSTSYGRPLRSRTLTKLIEGAQHTIEEINFASRKNVLEYDDVLNRQRQAIYDERNRVLDGEDLVAESTQICHALAEHHVEETPDDVSGVLNWSMTMMPREALPPVDHTMSDAEMTAALENWLKSAFDDKCSELGDELSKRLTTQVMLRVMDTRWRAYIQEMDYLKTGIGLRGFGQRDPLVEYKREAYNGFAMLVATMYEDFVRTWLNLEIRTERPDMERLKAKAS